MDSRERLLASTFIELADTLVSTYDLAEVLHTVTGRSVELFDVSGAGLMLADPNGTLGVVSFSNERAHVLELLQLEKREGPCWDCFRTGRPVTVVSLEEAHRWPDFARKAMDLGFRSMNVVPMRLREDVIGALDLFLDRVGGLDETDLRTAQALADVATIGILQERTIRHAEEAARQLQAALDSRVVIEQAKGILSEHLQMDVASGFELLRGYARRHNRTITEVAQALVTGYTSPSDLQT